MLMGLLPTAPPTARTALELLMLSDGENLTNLDCELEQTTPNPNWILQENLPFLKKYDVL